MRLAFLWLSYSLLFISLAPSIHTFASTCSFEPRIAYKVVYSWACLFSYLFFVLLLYKPTRFHPYSLTQTLIVYFTRKLIYKSCKFVQVSFPTPSPCFFIQTYVFSPSFFMSLNLTSLFSPGAARVILHQLVMLLILVIASSFNLFTHEYFSCHGLPPSKTPRKVVNFYLYSLCYPIFLCPSLRMFSWYSLLVERPLVVLSYFSYTQDFLLFSLLFTYKLSSSMSFSFPYKIIFFPVLLL